ncbi:hypothetical protein O2W14_07380 [Modestobacter sp. VKM Ac-2986]|uniref:hypothetical protein n=1 Tax=Modestobacter sp. VKM Ac-2986 TaxID=3004140 RepID=UPI0022AB1FE9|nr:hypothetical protein [Modestobacter sp. VKM Ac-2986]MCZ2828648.1 hypothetical protein [Modestobacter sp. VKM Ac-2986]
MTTPTENAVALGARRARQHLSLADAGHREQADFVIDVLGDPGALLAMGAGSTALARMAARLLPPAPRARAGARQLELARVRDDAGSDVDALRGWLRQATAEALAVTRLAEPDAAARRALFLSP